MSSKLTWFHTHVFISHWPPTHQLCPRTVLATNLTLFKKLPMLVLKLKTKWLNVTHVMVNTWLAASCTVVTLFQRTSMLPLEISKPKEPFNSLTGAQPVLRLVCQYQHLCPSLLNYKGVVHLRLHRFEIAPVSEQIRLLHLKSEALKPSYLFGNTPFIPINPSFRLVSITKLQLLSQVLIKLVSVVLYVCFPTQPPFLKLGIDSIVNSI